MSKVGLIFSLLLSFAGTTARAQIADSPEALSLKFHPAFKPRVAIYGGFGGGTACRQKMNHTPVVFIHGNADFAGNWHSKDSKGGPSVLQYFVKAGYTGCELYGISYLSPEERNRPQQNFHNPGKAQLISEFIKDVLAHTGANQVDIISHSLGVTMSLYAIEEANLWGSVRTYLAIAGAMHGLQSCLFAGPANPLSKTCGGAGLVTGQVFGFWPDGARGFKNHKLGNGAEALSRTPERVPRTRFYSIRAGVHDEVVCGLNYNDKECERSSMFGPARNVDAQINVGSGGTALKGGDAGDGVGHMRAKTDTARLQLNMIVLQCKGRQCCKGVRTTCAL